MSSNSVTHKNHYVPRMSLKRFCSRPGFIWRYSLLVPSRTAPVWEEKAITNAGAWWDLYTGVRQTGEEEDGHEKWFGKHFETPADPVIARAVSDQTLSDEDLHVLVRFLAAQRVRTPANLQAQLARWNESLPKLITTTTNESIERYKAAMKAGRAPIPLPGRCTPGYPVTTKIERSQQASTAEIKTDVLVGRRMWCWSHKHILDPDSRPLRTLLEHRWTVLRAPAGVDWPTSDNPVVQLNYNGPQNFDLKGGWGSVGTEIFTPLGPKHLLYTRIGEKGLPTIGSQVSVDLAKGFVRFIVRNAFRYVFSPTRSPDIPKLRPQHVDAEAFHAERKATEAFAKEQSGADRDFLEAEAGG